MAYNISSKYPQLVYNQFILSIKHVNLSVAMDIFVISLISKIKEKALIDTHCILKKCNYGNQINPGILQNDFRLHLLVIEIIRQTTNLNLTQHHL